MEERPHEGISDAPEGPDKRLKKISRKFIALAVVAILLGSSGVLIWYEYYRHWDIQDLEDAVLVRDESLGPFLDGFRTDLAGRTVTVEVEIDGVRTLQTSMGQLNLISPKDGEHVTLMMWGPLEYDVGDRIEVEVRFEWATINGNEGVYSPQTCLGIGFLEALQEIMQSLSWTHSELIMEMENDGDDVIISIERVPEPVPISGSNCTIRAGTHAGIFDYMDILGFYGDAPDIDTIQDLSDPIGPNGTLEFSDEDDDGYLDEGDTFTLHNLTKPNTECSAQTYIISVQRDPYPEEPQEDLRSMVFSAYIIMTQDGVLWITDSYVPKVTSFLSTVEDGFSLTIDYVSEPISWDDVDLLLSDETFNEVYYPNASSLDTGMPTCYSCGEIEIGNVLIECIVNDSTGNGYLDVDDRIDVLAREGTHLNESRSMTITGIYFAPSATNLFHGTYICGLVPSSECALEIDDHTVAVTFNPIHNGTGWDYHPMDVAWSDVIVAIGNGDTKIEWNLDSSYLDGREPASWISSGVPLGNLTLVCIVNDLQGNGLVNAGDTIEVIVTLGEGFRPDVEYSISIDYTPTDSPIYSAVFTG